MTAPSPPSDPQVILDALTARLARTESALRDHDAVLGDLGTTLADHTAAFEDLTVASANTPPLAAASGGEEETADPLYPSVVEFVEEFFVHVFARPLGGEFRWCPQWWDHAEAALLLEACWRTFEHLRLNPQTGISDWLTHHAYPHLHRLMSPTGPFARCSVDRATRPHEPDQTLRVTPPPPGWPGGNDPDDHAAAGLEGDPGAYPL